MSNNQNLWLTNIRCDLVNVSNRLSNDSEETVTSYALCNYDVVVDQNVCSAEAGLLTVPDNNLDNEDYFDHSMVQEETVKTSNYTGFPSPVQRSQSENWFS
jgi:hypothetical protein